MRTSVYVFDIGIDGLYKIGTSEDVDRRFIELSAGNPKLRVMFFYPVKNAVKHEQKLHNYYSKKHHSRELFILSQTDIDEIKKYLECTKPDFSISRKERMAKIKKDNQYEKNKIRYKRVSELIKRCKLYKIRVNNETTERYNKLKRYMKAKATR